MENLIITSLIALCCQLSPRDWRSWIICYGLYGGLLQLQRAF